MPSIEMSNDDALATMIRFKTSAIYEMIISLQTLFYPRRRSAWANQTRAQLSADFWEELSALYKPLDGWYIEFPELAIDYHHHHDIPGFLDYIRSMSPVDFIFYVIGRRLPRARIAEIGLDLEALTAAIRQEFDNFCVGEEALPPWRIMLDDVSAYQTRLVDLWEQYWNLYFCGIVESLQIHWEKGLAEHERILAREGSEALFQHLMGHKLKMPAPLPSDHPFTEIVLVPIYLTSNNVFMFYGYGNITVLVDAENTRARAAQIETIKDEALETLRALGDNTRLRILRLIAQNEQKINGKKLAAHLNLSTSAVSRHLSQLRDGRLIIEEPIDHRNITYRLQRDVILDLPEKLLEYLFS